MARRGFEDVCDKSSRSEFACHAGSTSFTSHFDTRDEAVPLNPFPLSPDGDSGQEIVKSSSQFGAYRPQTLSERAISVSWLPTAASRIVSGTGKYVAPPKRKRLLLSIDSLSAPDIANTCNHGGPGRRAVEDGQQVARPRLQHDRERLPGPATNREWTRGNARRSISTTC